MIVGIGLDLIEIHRIGEAVKKRDSFPEKVLTENELQKYETLSGKRKEEFLAGRFAAKEAFSKAYGTGIGKVGFQDIEILTGERGEPVITKSPFQGNAFVTITHTKTTAAAQVILEK